MASRLDMNLGEEGNRGEDVALLSDYRSSDFETDGANGNLDEPTSTKDIIGWSLYSWAAEPFIVSCVGTYVPLLLEQMARDNGVKLIDHSIACKEVLKIPEPIPPTQPSPIEKDGKKCVLPLFNDRLFIDTSSFALYTFAASVFVQTIVVISVTGVSDKGLHRKHILIGSSIVGGIFTMAFIFLDDSNFYWGSILAILANSCFGLVNVCGNSFLPILLNNHPTVLKSSPAEKASTKGQVSSEISGNGAALGYISALLVQVATMFMILKLKKDTPKGSTDDSIWPIQVAIWFVGLWWITFQTPVAILLKSRQGDSHLVIKDLDINTSNKFIHAFIKYPIILQCANQLHISWHYVRYGWKQLYYSLLQASQLKDIIIFLISWFIISDSLTTINSTAILFARSELHMSTLQLAIIGTLTMMSAIIGAYIIPNIIQPYLKVSLKTLLQLIIIWASIIPLYGLLGFFFETFGLKHNFEMFILAVWYGFSLGGIATVSRSLFSLLIPKGRESMYFALFQITDKGSSILGPIAVAMITDKTHNIRYCFWFLFAVLVVSLPVINLLDLERGNEEAKVLAAMDEEEE